MYPSWGAIGAQGVVGLLANAAVNADAILRNGWVRIQPRRGIRRFDLRRPKPRRLTFVMEPNRDAVGPQGIGGLLANAAVNAEAIWRNGLVQVQPG